MTSDIPQEPLHPANQPQGQKPQTDDALDKIVGDMDPAQDESDSVAEPPEELVILVHGTFSASDEDVGDAWWQRGSRFSEWLDNRLAGSNVRLSKKVFHWSGENSEDDRRAAGDDLFYNWIIRLEKEKIPYHLIGHSHGGSVIWHALCRSCMRAKQLRYLKSWTSIGTPFFTYRFSLSAVATLAYAFSCFVVVTLLLLLFLCLMEVAAYYEYLAPLSQPLPWNLFVAIVTGVCTGLISLVAWPLGKFLGSGDRRRREAWTMLLYGDLWLGLRSRTDEAIGSLSKVTHVPKAQPRLVPRRTPSFIRNFEGSARRARFQREWHAVVVFWVVMAMGAVVFRIMLRPIYWAYFRILDGMVLDVLVRIAQGNDCVEGEAIKAALPGPVDVGDAHQAYVPLPNSIDACLVEAAECKALEVMPDVVLAARRSIGHSEAGGTLFDLVGFLNDTMAGMAEQTLVHTSYFANRDVRELVALHVESRAGRGQSAEHATRHPELMEWLDHFRESVITHVLETLEKKAVK